MKSSTGHFPGNRQLRGGADGLRRSLGPETLQQPSFPARAQPGQGRGASRWAGGSRDVTVTARAAGQGGLALGLPGQQTSAARASQSRHARGGGGQGCSVATSPQSSWAPGRNHAAAQGQVFCLKMGPGHLPTTHPPRDLSSPRFPSVPGQDQVSPRFSLISLRLQAAASAPRRGMHTALTRRHSRLAGWGGHRAGPRTPSLQEAEQDGAGDREAPRRPRRGKQGRMGQGTGRPPDALAAGSRAGRGRGQGHSGRRAHHLKHTWFDPWLANSHAARKK